MRITRSLVLAALLLAAPVAAQETPDPLDERPFALTGRFEPGERWSTCGGLRLRATGEGRPPLEASIAWTHSVLVVSRPGGFALRGTLTSLVWEERRDGVMTVRSWTADAPGPLGAEEARTWTYGLDRTWALLDVDGPERSILWLLERLKPDPADPVTTELERRLARRAADGVEAFLLASADQVGQPVRKALASLGAGPLLPGRSWTLEPRQGAGGHSRFVGLEGAGARFEAAWDVDGDRALQARFVVDPLGRLRWMSVQHTEQVAVEGGTLRAVDELTFGLLRVVGEEPGWVPTLLAR